MLVVGGGNSASDLAVEAVATFGSADLSMRSGYWFIPKTIFGIPSSEWDRVWLPMPVQRLGFKILLRFSYPQGNPSLRWRRRAFRGRHQRRARTGTAICELHVYGLVAPRSGAGKIISHGADFLAEAAVAQRLFPIPLSDLLACRDLPLPPATSPNGYLDAEKIKELTA